MQLPGIIKASLDYIEDNLRTDITAEELARMAGYSTYHFYRLFSSVTESSVSSYILRRRLDHALSEIAQGRKAVDVVLEYGFDTYAGFYKAFKKMYGCSPKKYISIYRDHTPKKPEVANMYTEKELHQLLENWDIDKRASVRDIYIMDGAKPSGTDWEIGDSFVLRTGDRDKLQRELRVAKALARQGFSSPMPVSTRAGGDYLDGRDIFILSRRLEGTALSKTDRYGENRVLYAREYGRSIARLHKALKEIQKDISPDEVNMYRVVADWALPAVRQQNLQWDMGLGEAFFTDYLETFAKLYDKLPKQLIHRNPHPGNILFSGGQVSGFINFELCEINVRLFDVCYCSTGILSESADRDYVKWPDVLAGILYGYDAEAKLTPAEKQAVYYVICSISMICAAYFEAHDEFRQLAKTSRKILDFAVRNKDRITQIF